MNNSICSIFKASLRGWRKGVTFCPPNFHKFLFQHNEYISYIYAIYCKIKQTGVLDYLYSFGIFFCFFYYYYFKLTHISCLSVSLKCQKLLNKNGGVSCFPIVLSEGISVIACWSVSPPCQQASFIFLFL